ncbi:MAG: hypothetical protein DRO88_03640 [Promethearchaeia archaeon]|nr:MAG: hypothetical protein DRO88_03640 [Candidatus Lokiarchaeia archaeon]
MSLEIKPSEIDKPIVITLTPKLKEFIRQKCISEISIDVKLEEQPCVQIYSPLIHLGKKKQIRLENLYIQEFDGIKFKFTRDFFSRFHLPDSLTFSLKGFLKKRVEILEIEPIILNVCKV